MSVKVMTWVWDHSASRGSDRLVLLAIADCASEDGSNAYPSMAELVRKTGLSERAVQYAIKALVGLGELFVAANGGPRGCNRYRVVMADEGVQDMHPANLAPRTESTPHEVHPPAPVAPSKGADAAPGVHEVRSKGATGAPGTVLEPSKNSSSKSSSRTRGTRLPDNFGITREMREWAAEEIPGFGIDREHMRFRDHWRGAAGAKGVKLDWIATWRNWMRRAADQVRPTVGRQPHQPYTNPTDPDAYSKGL